MSVEEQEHLAEGSLISHLLELRDRLLRAVIAVAVLFVPCAIFSKQLFTLIALPLFGETFGIAALVGMGVTVAGVALASRG